MLPEFSSHNFQHYIDILFLGPFVSNHEDKNKQKKKHKLILD